MQRAAQLTPTALQPGPVPNVQGAYSTLGLQRPAADSLTGQRRESPVEEEATGSERPALSHLEHHFSRLTVYPRTTANTTAVRSWPKGQSSDVPGSFSLPVRGEPVPYRDRMEQAFNTDISTVNAFPGASDLLAPFGALAAAWPETLAFASRTPSPQMVAHELAHVLQYRTSPPPASAQRGAVRNDDPAEVEARRAALRFDLGAPLRLQARPGAVPMLYTDEEDLDSQDFLQERPPQFTNQAVGTWGNSWPATLIARERSDASFPEEQRSHALIEAIARREAMVLIREYGRLWIYRLEWEGLSARYSRFTNASTMFSQGSEKPGNYSVSNVMGRRGVEAFVTEDGGVLSPPGAGKLFYHTGGEFEDPLVSKFQNVAAFVEGLGRGLEQANFAGLAERLRRMAALNTVFPAPFAIGAVHGLANEIIELAQWLKPQQWKAVEAAVRQTILTLNDPDGEDVAAAFGEEFGRAQAAALDRLLQKSLPVFAYEVGKLVGPTIVEIVLAFVGIEIGPLAVFQKTLTAAKAMPDLAGVLRSTKAYFPDIPDRPGFPRQVEGEAVVGKSSTMKGAEDHDLLPTTPRPSPALPELSPQEQALLVKTGDRAEFPGRLPDDLAAKELAIVRRSEKAPITESGGKYINEVDLGNGHKWKEQPAGIWCRFSNGGTNCTILIDEPMPKLPGTVVAHAPTKAALRDIYFGWAEYRAAVNVEVALLRSRGTPEYPEGTYAVVVGDTGQVAFPGRSEDWITIAHSHPSGPDQPGFVNPSGADLQSSLFGNFGRSTGRIRRWVHSQTPTGEWREVEYGLDLDSGQYYIRPTGGEPLFFEELHDQALRREDLEKYKTLHMEGKERERIDLMIEQNGIEYYLGWYARQFSFVR